MGVLTDMERKPYERLLIVQSEAQANVPGGHLCERGAKECNRAEGKRGIETYVKFGGERILEDIAKDFDSGVG